MMPGSVNEDPRSVPRRRVETTSFFCCLRRPHRLPRGDGCAIIRSHHSRPHRPAASPGEPPMGIVQHLSALALGPAVKTACDAAGGLAAALAARFKDNSQRLGQALARANERAWQTLEVALAGDSWWQRVK